MALSCGLTPDTNLPHPKMQIKNLDLGKQWTTPIIRKHTIYKRKKIAFFRII